MTFDEARARVNQQLDALYDDAMDRTADTLTDHGATAEELATALRWQHDAFETMRRQALNAVVGAFYSGTAGLH
jgi:hypothetical protein